MSQSQTQPTGLNEVQLTLLRLFNRPMSEQDIIRLRDQLTTYYADQLLSSVDSDVIERNITEVEYERLRQGGRG